MFVEERTIKLGPWSTCTDITPRDMSGRDLTNID